MEMGQIEHGLSRGEAFPRGPSEPVINRVFFRSRRVAFASQNHSVMLFERSAACDAHWSALPVQRFGVCLSVGDRPVFDVVAHRAVESISTSWLESVQRERGHVVVSLLS